MSVALQEQLNQSYIELFTPGPNFALMEQEVSLLFEASIPHTGFDSEDERRHVLDELYGEMEVFQRVHGWSPTVSMLREHVIRENAVLGGMAPELADIYAITTEARYLFELGQEQQEGNPDIAALHSYFLREINRKAQNLHQE